MTELWTPPENEFTSLVTQPNFLDMTYMFQRQLDEMRDEDEKFILGKHALTMLDSIVPKQVPVDIHASSARLDLSRENSYVDLHDIGLVGRLNDVSLSVPPVEKEYTPDERRRHYQLMLELDITTIYPILERESPDERRARGFVPIMAAMSIALSADGNAR